jgi:hypothetical protein
MKSLIKIAAAAAFLLPSTAFAATYSVVGDFGGSVFQYGYGQGGVSFTSYGAPKTCGGFLTCYNNNGNLPEVIGNTTSTTYSDGGAVIPGNTVYAHPGAGVVDSDTIIRFVAPTAGTYSISGVFTRRNPTDGAGDGVRVSVFSGATLLYSGALPATTLGASVSYGPLASTLASGGTLDFVVSNGVGGHGFDGTGVAATITTNANVVPEPATWAMMVGGFGLLGAASRRQRLVAQA